MHTHIHECICISSCIEAEMNKKFDALNGMPPPNVCRVAATNTPLQICMYICICKHLCTPCRHLEDRLVIQVCAHIVNILVAKLTSFEYCCASQPTIGTIAHIYTHVLVCVCGCCAFICSYLFMQQCTVVCWLYAHQIAVASYLVVQQWRQVTVQPALVGC